MAVRPIYSYRDANTETSQSREIGIGIAFADKGVFTSTITTTQQVKNQLVNFILTNPGERLFDPYFGSGIKALLFEQNTDLDAIASQLQEKIELYVQNIRVKDVSMTGDDSNNVFISITYSIFNQEDTLNVTITNETI